MYMICDRKEGFEKKLTEEGSIGELVVSLQNNVPKDQGRLPETKSNCWE